MKTAFLVTVTAFALLLSSQTPAAGEEISVSMEAKSKSGPLFRELARPVKASLTVKVSVPQGAPRITPLKFANVTFPKDMTFNPNSRRTPACPSTKVGDQSNLAAGIAEIVDLCPRSVVGTGTAIVQLGQSTKPQSTLRDTQMVIFNAGRDAVGRPKIVIYAFSPSANTGVLMRGVLEESGELKINIGVLPFDSSVSEFTLGIPGDPLTVPNLKSKEVITVRGQDPDYLRAKCSRGAWLARGEFLVGSRDFPSGVPTGDETLIRSDPFELLCKASEGKPALTARVIGGPRVVASRAQARFRLKLRNVGSATAKDVRLRATGLATGNFRVGSLKPGGSRVVPFKVRVRPAGLGKRVGRIVFQMSAEDRPLAPKASARLTIVPSR